MNRGQPRKEPRATKEGTEGNRGQPRATEGNRGQPRTTEGNRGPGVGKGLTPGFNFFLFAHT